MSPDFRSSSLPVSARAPLAQLAIAQPALQMLTSFIRTTTPEVKRCAHVVLVIEIFLPQFVGKTTFSRRWHQKIR